MAQERIYIIITGAPWRVQQDRKRLSGTPGTAVSMRSFPSCQEEPTARSSVTAAPQQMNAMYACRRGRLPQPPVRQRGKPGSMPQESHRTKKWIGSLNRLNRMRFSPAARVPSLSRRFGRRGPPPARSCRGAFAYFIRRAKRCSPLRTRLSHNGTDSCRFRYALAHRALAPPDVSEERDASTRTSN